MLQSVLTALTVFEAVAEHQPIGVSDLSRKLSLPKSTVQRCLTTLHEAGWLRPEGGAITRWVITAKAFSLGREVANSRHLHDMALPMMENLRDVTQESVHLVVAEGREVVLIERLESPLPVRTIFPLGMRAPLHATAYGKAILTYLSPEALDTYLAQGLEVLTPHTVHDPDVLRKELEVTRMRGWAATTNELGDGVSAIAAAILDRQGRPVAGLSIAYPSHRLSEETRQRFGELVVDTVSRISSRLSAG